MFWNKFLSMAVIASSAICFSCSYDDDDVWNAINDQEARIEALERWQETTNSNIAALQAIVNGNDFIKSVTPVTENGQTIGYTISFLRQGDVTIYHGTKGDKGDQGNKGDKGDKGDSGVTPVISVTSGDDGRWYWTLNGELLKDANGNPVCASGKDGQDGANGADGANGTSAPTPQLKTGSELGSGYVADAVYLSIDGGATWTRVSGKDGQDGADGADGVDGSNGSNGDNVFDSENPIQEYAEYYVIKLSDGTSFMIPKYYRLQLRWRYSTDGPTYNYINGGKCEVEAGKEIVLLYSLLEDSPNSLSWVAFDDENERVNVTESGSRLTIPAITEGHSITIIFSLTDSYNQTTFFKATFTAAKKVVIESDENKGLADAVAEVLGITPDENGNVAIPEEVINNTTEINLSGKELTDISQLSEFVNLQKLNVANNDIAELDVTKLPESLTELNVSNNNITSLDLSSLPNLVTLNCSKNSLSELNIEKLVNLESLDISNCFNQTVSRSGNVVETIDLSNNVNLTGLNCGNCEFSKLDLSNLTNLEYLYASFNYLTSLDFRNNTKLRHVEAYNNNISSIDVTNCSELWWLNLQFNSLTHIDLSNNKKLDTLNVGNNNLTSLDVSNLTLLRNLYCQINRISSLDVSAITIGSVLNCGSQQDNIVISLTLNAAQKVKWESEWSSRGQNKNVVIAN